jgi:hypothetical protein
VRPRRALRQARPTPILADIKDYIEAQQPKALPKSAIGEAFPYAVFELGRAPPLL